MGKSLLLLHHRYTPDDQAIWRAALQRGWNTERIGTARIDIERKTLGYSKFRYYGNVLHQENCEGHMPIRFAEIDIKNLVNLPIEYTKRKIELLKARDVVRPLTQAAFYKCPGIKWIESRVYDVGQSFECKPDDWIYKQEPIELTREVRCFVLDGEIVTASYYRNTNKEFEPHEFINIPQDLRDLARNVFNAAKWPHGVVFDFGILEKTREWLFIEANEAWASGLYDCDPDKCFDVICASQESK